MNSKLWIRKALSMCLVVATIATYSMVALAGSEKIAGELLVDGKNFNGTTPFVKVNGEAAQSGRSIFSSSSIVTPDNASAVINLGKIGKIELAPATTFDLSFNENGISGDLVAGRVTVLDSTTGVNIKMIDGSVARLNAGESATTGATKAQDDTSSSGGSAWIAWAAILGGAAVGIVLAATTDNNRIAVTSGTTVVSPTR